MEIASAPVNHYWRSIAFGIAAICLGSSLYLRIVSNEIRMINYLLILTMAVMFCLIYGFDWRYRHEGKFKFMMWLILTGIFVIILSNKLI
jgi:hypothetical protein